MDQSEVRERNIRKVIKTAQDLFVEYGVNKTPISRIAQECGLSEMSIYRYFQNRDNLVFAVWRDSLNTFYNTLMPLYNERSKNLTTGYERFFCCIDCEIEIYTQYPRWIIYTREMFSAVDTQPHRREPGETGGEVDAYWEFYGREIPLPLQTALEQGLQDGSIRPDINIYEVYQLIFNVYTGHNIYEHFTGSHDPTDIFRLTVKILKEYIKA